MGSLTAPSWHVIRALLDPCVLLHLLSPLSSLLPGAQRLLLPLSMMLSVKKQTGQAASPAWQTSHWDIGGPVLPQAGAFSHTDRQRPALGLNWQQDQEKWSLSVAYGSQQVPEISGLRGQWVCPAESEDSSRGCGRWDSPSPRGNSPLWLSPGSESRMPLTPTIMWPVTGASLCPGYVSEI